jgi:hypothetical protein
MKQSFKSSAGIQGRDLQIFYDFLRSAHQERSNGRVDMKGLDLRGACVRAREKGQWLHVHKFDFSGSDFSGASFFGVRFRRSNFVETDFNGARFETIRFEDCSFGKTNFSKSKIQGLCFDERAPIKSNFNNVSGDRLYIFMSPLILKSDFLDFDVRNIGFFVKRGEIGVPVTGISICEKSGRLVPEAYPGKVVLPYESGTRDFRTLYKKWLDSFPSWERRENAATRESPHFAR